MIDFLTLLTSAKAVYENGKAINELLIDKTAQIINAIGERELNSALKTIDDMRYSKNAQRELSSVITQLRLSLEKLSYKTNKKTKVSLLIALCYKSLGEYELTSQFGNRSITFFNEWIEYERSRIFIPAKDMWRGAILSQVKDDLDEMGIIYNEQQFNGKYASDRAEYVVYESKKYFATYVKNILSH